MAVAFVDSADALVYESEIDVETEFTLTIPWPSTTDDDLIVWVVAHSTGAGAVDVEWSNDGIPVGDWTESVLWQYGSRGFHVEPVSDLALYVGVFRIETAMGLPAEPSMILHFTVDPDGEQLNGDFHEAGFAACFGVAAYTGWDAAEFFFSDFTTNPVTGRPIAPSYPATDADMVVRYVASLYSGSIAPPPTKWDPAYPSYSFTERAVINADDYDDDNPPHARIIFDAGGDQDENILMPNLSIQDQAAVTDTGEQWAGSRSVLIAQVVMNEVGSGPPTGGGGGTTASPCFFRYDERWPDLAPQLFTDADMARVLDDRDIQLEDYIRAHLCCGNCEGGEAEVCDFRYDERWTEILPRLRAAARNNDAEMEREMARVLDDRDTQLEDFLTNRVCCDCEGGGGGGVN